MELNKDYNAVVGLRIRNIREALHMTREQFSELCDISNSFMADVERGKKSITVKTLNKICTAAHISADYIVLGHDSDFSYNAILEILRSLPQNKLNSAIVILEEYSNAVRN